MSTLNSRRGLDPSRSGETGRMIGGHVVMGWSTPGLMFRLVPLHRPKVPTSFTPSSGPTPVYPL